MTDKCAARKTPCDPSKVCNPDSGRCVLKTGAIGTKLLAGPRAPRACPPCDPTKMCNPDSGRCVLKTGAIGKKLARAGPGAAAGVRYPAQQPPPPPAPPAAAARYPRQPPPPRAEFNSADAKFAAHRIFDGLHWDMTKNPSAAVFEIWKNDDLLSSTPVTRAQLDTPMPGMREGDHVYLDGDDNEIEVVIKTPTVGGFLDAVHRGVQLYPQMTQGEAFTHPIWEGSVRALHANSNNNGQPVTAWAFESSRR